MGENHNDISYSILFYVIYYYYYYYYYYSIYSILYVMLCYVILFHLYLFYLNEPSIGLSNGKLVIKIMTVRYHVCIFSH